MKKSILLILITLLILFACNKTPTTEQKTGDIPLKFSLKPAFDMGYDVTRVTATITKDDYENSLNLTVEGDSASGTFYNLEPGLYNITVEVYDHNTLIAHGSGTGEVVAGETTTVYITLEFIDLTGNLEIIVDWANVYDTPDSILFIGNSYTYVNGGIDTHFKRLAESAHPELVIKSSKVAYPAYTLEQHANNATTIATISSGGWDYIVLQEQSTRPIEESDLFYHYATVLDTLIRDNGAKTAFFMTWARENDPDMIEGLAGAYNYIGNQLNAGVVPVGRAFQKAIKEDSDISLYNSDHSHPNTYGTYLAVCTFYSFFYNESPVGIEYTNDENMNDNEKEFLQYVAWETYNEYCLN